MTTLAHAFDIETSGPRIGRHSLMSIAAVCLEIPKRGAIAIIDQFFMTIRWPEGLVFDEKTRQFWTEHPAAFAISTTNTVPVKEVAQALYNHVYNVQKKAHLRNAKYVVVTDNSYFDVAWIDWFLSTYTETGMPLRHNYFSGWMRTDRMINLSERLCVLQEAGYPLDMRFFHASVLHDHTPLNDAKVLAEKYAYYKRQLRAVRHSDSFALPRGDVRPT
jgi:hypothetical protein